jgi:hypothetical protein
MALDISTQLTGSSAAAFVQPPVQASLAVDPAATDPAPASDTVKLSAAAQVHALYQQGESASTIASSLGTDIATVDSDLGITTTSTGPVGGGGGGPHGGSHATASTQETGSTSASAGKANEFASARSVHVATT